MLACNSLKDDNYEKAPGYPSPVPPLKNSKQ